MDRQISEDIDVENFTETAMNSMLIQAGCPVKPGSKRPAVINDREEMVMRKKLRNRESAQRARDRQKAKMRWLEEELQKMKTTNEQIVRENILLKHMLSESQNKSNPANNSPPQPNNLALQLQQQQRINQLQIQRLQRQQQQTVNQVQAKLMQEQSNDSDNSIPSNISTGSNNIAMKGDDLLKFAANRTQGMNVQVQQPINAPLFDPQQQYAAALAALAQNNMPNFNPVAVDGKQRPSSVGGSNPSNCNTSDDDKAH